jgi:hypothetical protein
MKSFQQHVAAIFFMMCVLTLIIGCHRKGTWLMTRNEELEVDEAKDPRHPVLEYRYTLENGEVCGGVFWQEAVDEVFEARVRGKTIGSYDSMLKASKAVERGCW